MQHKCVKHTKQAERKLGRGQDRIAAWAGNDTGRAAKASLANFQSRTGIVLKLHVAI